MRFKEKSWKEIIMKIKFEEGSNPKFNIKLVETGSRIILFLGQKSFIFANFLLKWKKLIKKF